MSSQTSIQVRMGRSVSSANLEMREERRQFEWMILRHVDAAYNLARWFVRNDQDAEDIVQDSVVSAFKSFSKFKGADGKPWLLKIIRNNCLRHLDRQRRRQTDPLEENYSGTSLVADLNDPEAKLIRSADAAHVHRIISEMPESFREVIVLREFEELSYSEMAEVIEAPIGTVMSRLARARSYLANRLREEMSEVQP